MITVTRFDQSEFIINADLIEFVEACPDTHVTLVTGKKILVRESPEQIVERVLEYRRLAGPLLQRSVNHEALKTSAAKRDADAED